MIQLCDMDQQKELIMVLKIKHGQLIDTQFIISPHYNDRPIGAMINMVVIHNISLPPNQYGGPYVEQLFTGHLDPNEHEYFKSIYQLQVSSHLFIRRTGEMIQFVSFDKRAWHAGISEYLGRHNCNDYSIGIELEGCDSERYTDKQYQQLIMVTQCLTHYYPIEHIVGHSDIAPNRKTDPGAYFDWYRYLNKLT